MRKRLFLGLCFIAFSSQARLNTICHSWPMAMAKQWLQDKNIVEEKFLDEDKTQFKLLASEILENNQYNDVYWFVFFDQTGRKYDLITQNISSDEECSMSDVNIYRVSDYQINQH